MALTTNLHSMPGDEFNPNTVDSINFGFDCQEYRLTAHMYVLLAQQLRAQLGTQLWTQLGTQLWTQLGTQLGTQLWDNLGDQLWDKLRDTRYPED